MNTIHEPFTRQMNDRLETMAMGLGLIRLLQDARRFEEANDILHLLEEGREPVAKATSTASSPKRIDADEMRHYVLSIV